MNDTNSLASCVIEVKIAVEIIRQKKSISVRDDGYIRMKRCRTYTGVGRIAYANGKSYQRRMRRGW